MAAAAGPHNGAAGGPPQPQPAGYASVEVVEFRHTVVTYRVHPTAEAAAAAVAAVNDAARQGNTVNEQVAALEATSAAGQGVHQQLQQLQHLQHLQHLQYIQHLQWLQSMQSALAEQQRHQQQLHQQHQQQLPDGGAAPPLAAALVASMDPASLGRSPASPDAVAALPRCAVGAETVAKLDGAGIECAVCLSGFAEGDVAAEMPCAHPFHEDCLTRWLRERRTCPCCRHELPPA